MLDKIALAVIGILIIGVAAVIVFIGSVPGKIARGRNHPWPDAVNAASWIGLATGVLWPFAFVWAFLPVPAKPTDRSADEPAPDLADLQKRLADLETAIKELQPQRKENAV
jgi:hypothetical protein